MAGYASSLMPGVFGGASPGMLDARVAINQGQRLDAEDAGEVVRQFEAMFVRQMLKSMREATRSLGDGLLSGGDTDGYLEMFDGQIANRLVAGRGIGIGDMLRTQLGLAGDVPAPRRLLAPPSHPASSTPSVIPPVSQPAGATRAFADAADFVRSLLPLVTRTARRLGVNARGVLAQMALETGWGQHVPPARDGRSSHNLFGIKAGRRWQGETTTLATLELEDGVLQRRQARFRVYDSPVASLEDYAALLENDARYAEVLSSGDSVSAFAAALQAAGYATDPDYAHKIQSIAGGELARLIDAEGAKP